MDREEIMKLLPHRENMLLLDSIGRDGEWALGSYKVRGDEFFLKGHFPAFPVVPGVILCEILAQSACILIGDVKEGMIPVYAGLDNVRFKSPVRPGDTFCTKCRIVRRMGSFFFAEGEGYVGGTLAIKASFSFAVTESGCICSSGS